MINVRTYITFEKKPSGIKAPATLIKKCCVAAANAEKADRDCEVSVLVTDSGRVHELNRDYRNVDHTTDVLSFPLFDDENTPKQLGDIVLNVDKIYEQAKEYGHSREREMAFLTVHSMLHLFGYDHEQEDERKEMRLREEAILKDIATRD